VSITQVRIRPLWLVGQTSLSFFVATISQYRYIDWRPGPWYATIVTVRRREASLGSVPTVLGRDMQKVELVIVDAVDLLYTRCLDVSSDASSSLILPASTYRALSKPLSPFTQLFSFSFSLSRLQTYSQHAHAGRPQCLHTKRDDGTMLPCRHHQSQHAHRQSVRKFIHGRVSASFCMCMHSISNSRAMVPGERSWRHNLARRPDFPMGSHSNPLDRSRSMHWKLHGMINCSYHL
jgi:hypothetical protein